MKDDFFKNDELMNPDYDPYEPPASALKTEDAFPPPEKDDPQSGEELASRGTRLGAAILDGLVTFIFVLPGAFILAVGALASIPEGVSLAGGVLMGLGALAIGVYQWYLIATTGQSLGKKWLGIKIVRQNGDPIGFLHGVVLRSWIISLLSNIPKVGFVVGLVDVLFIFGQRKLCLHDHIANTKVIVS